MNQRKPFLLVHCVAGCPTFPDRLGGPGSMSHSSWWVRWTWENVPLFLVGWVDPAVGTDRWSGPASHSSGGEHECPPPWQALQTILSWDCLISAPCHSSGENCISTPHCLQKKGGGRNRSRNK